MAGKGVDMEDWMETDFDSGKRPVIAATSVLIKLQVLSSYMSREILHWPGDRYRVITLSRNATSVIL